MAYLEELNSRLQGYAVLFQDLLRFWCMKYDLRAFIAGAEKCCSPLEVPWCPRTLFVLCSPRHYLASWPFVLDLFPKQDLPTTISGSFALSQIWFFLCAENPCFKPLDLWLSYNSAGPLNFFPTVIISSFSSHFIYLSASTCTFKFTATVKSPKTLPALPPPVEASDHTPLDLLCFPHFMPLSAARRLLSAKAEALLGVSQSASAPPLLLSASFFPHF